MIDYLIPVQKLWQEAFKEGNIARNAGLLRICNLTDDRFLTPGREILKVYKSAWEQGWDVKDRPISAARP